MMRAIRLLPVAFIFTGIVTFVDRGLNEELSRLSGIRAQFTSAVSDAKGRLSAASWAAISDPQIHQNLEMGNVNTVAQSLQSYVRPGEVSQVDMIDGECNLVARVPQNGKPIADLCQAVKSAKPALIWHVNEQNEAALVSVVSREVAGKAVYLAAELVFDNAWLSMHPGLAQLHSARDISLVIGGAGSLLWREGKMSDGRYALPLSVDGLIYRVAPELTGLALVPMRESFWVLYGALGVIMVLALLQVASDARSDESQRAALEGWIREHQLVKAGSSDGGDEPPATWKGIVDAAKSLIASRDEQRSQQLRLLRERVESLTGRLRDRDQEIADLESKLAGMSDLASLQEQLQLTTSSFLRQIGEMRDRCEDIYDVASSGLTRHAKELHAFCARWKHGLSQGTNREMAARKFFRTLVETRGTIPGWSKLDEDMRDLDQMTTSTLDQALSLSMLAQRAVEDCESVAKLAAMWRGIATRDRSEKTSDWMDCLISAQRLVSADERFKTMTFEKLPQLGDPGDMYPAVASAALISGFFHLYLALLDGADVSALTLPMVIRQKRFKDQATIILSLPSRHVGTVPESPDRKMMYHVELARQIMSGCGVKVSILPPTVAGYPVGLTWSLPRKDIQISVERGSEAGGEVLI